MLIILFVVGMIFVNLNLFYAILISTLSEARQTQEVKQAKANEKLKEKIYGFLETAARVLKLQSRFRQCFPGLYSRMKTWEKNRMVLERKRDDRLMEKAQGKKESTDIEGALGSASPSCGRRKARKRADVGNIDDDARSEVSEAESEPDLGNLFFKEQLNPHRFAQNHHEMIGDMHHDESMPNPFGQPMDPEEMERERENHAKEMVLEATEYVCETIKDRCRGARQLVLSEMNDARQVFQGISSVLEVLGRRARSLEAQQEMVLPPEVVARVKEEQEED